MSGSKDPYLERAMLDVVLGAVAYVAPTTVQLALYIVTPSELSLGTEASWTNYTRLTILNDSSQWSVAATQAGVTSKWNLLALRWPTAVAPSPQTLTGWALFDGANRLYFGSLVSSKVVSSGKKPVFPAGALILREE